MKVDYSRYPQGEVKFPGILIKHFNVKGPEEDLAQQPKLRMPGSSEPLDVLAWMKSQGVAPQTQNTIALGMAPDDPRAITDNGKITSPYIRSLYAADPHHAWGLSPEEQQHQVQIDQGYQPPANYMPHAAVTATSGGHPLQAAYYMARPVQQAVAARGITPMTHEAGVADPYYLAALQEYARQQPQQPITRAGKN